MSRIQGRNTAPERAIRSMLHSMGFRFRLHRKDLPGTPDIVFVSRKKAIFINGCFWHGHRCRRGKLPTSNSTFWRRKIEGNKERDRRNLRRLRSAGWETLVIWQCTLKDVDAMRRRVVNFLA